MKKLLIIPLIIFCLNCAAQNKFHVRVDCSRAHYYQISYTGDNWKTVRQIREFSVYFYYKKLYDTPQEAVVVAKEFKTYQQCEDNNRAEYRKYLEYTLKGVKACCKTIKVY